MAMAPMAVIIHTNDKTQPSLPIVHRTFVNPAPLGLLLFAIGGSTSKMPRHHQTLTIPRIFLISIYGVNARGIATPNVLVGVLMFFGGLCQFIAGIMEFVAGKTFGATVFPAYGVFNLSYAMIYIPGIGILASYTDAATGEF